MEKENKPDSVTGSRTQIETENWQPIWDEIRPTVQQIKLEDASIEELKSVLQKLSDTFRDNHPELTYKEWLLTCMRKDIEVRCRFGFDRDVTFVDMRDKIYETLKRKELLKKLNPYKSLSDEEIFKILKYNPDMRPYAEVWAWEDRIYKEYRPLEKLRRADVENMTSEELRTVHDQLWDEIYLSHLEKGEDVYVYIFKWLKLYCRLLRTYGLRDVLSEGMPLREAVKNLRSQIWDIICNKENADDDLPEEPED